MNSCEKFVQSEENDLEWYVSGSIEPLIQGVRLAEVVDTKDVISKNEFKRMWTIKKQQRWKEKRVYGQFVESTDAKKT